MKLLRGDCRERLRELDADSIDAVVTDPPYGLSKEPDIAKVLTHWLAGDDYQHGSGGFMGKTWDSFVPGPTYWCEVYRAMKPGAHLVAFGGTRTYDLLVIAIRMAGFEIRDQLAWMNGTGFPKSMNVSKALDKAVGADRPSQWNGWGTALKPAQEPIVLARKPFKSTVASNVLKHGTGALNIDATRITTDENLGGGAYSGGSRNTVLGDARSDKAAGMYGVDGRLNPEDFKQPPGRWPANVVLSHHSDCVLRGTKQIKSHNPDNKTIEDGAATGVTYGDYNKRSSVGHATDGKETVEDWSCVESCPVRLLDEQSGKSKGAEAERVRQDRQADSGGASRFFYCAKAAKKERNKGCEALYWTKDGKPLTEAEWSKLPEKERRQGNIHITVKPVALMRWLVRLVTPPGGKVLDPFMGSGSTGIAAKEEGFGFIGIELEESSHTIADARIEAAEAGTR